MRGKIKILIGVILLLLVSAMSFGGDSLQVYITSLRVALTDLPRATLGFLIFAALLIIIHESLLAKRLKKIREAIDRIYRGEWGVCVGLKEEGGLGGLANDFNKMSRRLKEIRDDHLGHLNDLTEDYRFRGLLSQMILSLQGCFARDDLYAKVTHFLSLIFPEDSGALFVGTAPDKLEPVAVWGPSPPKKAFATHNCLALWKWQVHCGTACDQSFRCPQKNPDSHVHICVPFDKQPEVVGLLQILSGPREHKITSKKRHASIVAEHIGLILVSMRMNEDLLNQTLRDPLTGLFNRRFLEEALKVEISRAVRHHKFLGIVMIDLDHFKQFNDTYGHPAGDVLLKEIGFLLQRNVRSSDIACRYGGEEFTLVLAEASRENVLHRTEEIRVKARKLRVWYLYQWLSGLSLSAGVAIYPEHGNTPEALLIAADRALYRAKETGRDRVCLAGEDQGWGTASGRGT